jgi:DNA-binding transcriptional ArsR family regulator
VDETGEADARPIPADAPPRSGAGAHRTNKAREALWDPRVAKAFSHPLRAKILTILGQRRASPRQLADELGVPLQNLSYHVRALVGLKLIRLVDVKARRGSIEHYYEAISGVVRVPDDAWASLPAIEQQAVASSILNEIGADVGESLACGGFEDANAHLTRTNALLDRQAFAELSKALHSLYALIARLEGDSSARLAAGDHKEEPSPTGLVLMLYKKPSALGGSSSV